MPDTDNSLNRLLVILILSRAFKTIGESRPLILSIGGGCDFYLCAHGRQLTMMFARLKKNRFPLKPKLFTIRWYPSNRSCCVNPGDKRLRPQQIPPLMVRKAEWRR